MVIKVILREHGTRLHELHEEVILTGCAAGAVSPSTVDVNSANDLHTVMDF